MREGTGYTDGGEREKRYVTYSIFRSKLVSFSLTVARRNFIETSRKREKERKMERVLGIYIRRESGKEREIVCTCRGERRERERERETYQSCSGTL